MSGLSAYDQLIQPVKEKILEQKVPTKYAKGLAILCVLNCEYEGGDAFAGILLDTAIRSDPELIEILEKEAGLEKGSGLDRFRIVRIRDAFGKDYQIFRALNRAGIGMDLMECIREVA